MATNHTKFCLHKKATEAHFLAYFSPDKLKYYQQDYEYYQQQYEQQYTNRLNLQRGRDNMTDILCEPEQQNGNDNLNFNTTDKTEQVGF